MAAKILPSSDYLRQMFSYDPESGNLLRKVYRSSNAPAGVVAGYLSDRGYLFVRLDNHLYRAHRIAWAIHYGSSPVTDIDHINGIPSDNRIINLRSATHLQNMKNTSAHSNNKSGHKGVCWDGKRKKWLAQIISNGKYRFLGRFPDIADAVKAYALASKELHGEFGRT